MVVEPKEEDIPKDPTTFSLEAQQSLVVMNALPDNWDGMNGVWLGKDYSGFRYLRYFRDHRKEKYFIFKNMKKS